MAQRPEDDKGQNADVHSRDHEHVVSAGALEVNARIAIDEGFLADHHGIDERRLATAHWTSDGEEIQSGEVYLVGMPIGRAEGHEIFEAEVLRSHCGSSVAVLTS